MLCALFAIATGIEDSPREALVRQLVAALNTKDEAKIATFFRANGTDSATPEERAKRFVGVASQVTPIEIVRFGRPLPRELKTLVFDGQKNEATLSVMFGPKDPPRIEAIWIRLGNSVDRPPEPNYAEAKDLASLVRMVRGYYGAPAFGADDMAAVVEALRIAP